MDLTPSGILTPNIPSKGVEGSSKASKGHKKNKQDEKPKEVAVEVVNDIVPTKTRKRILKRTDKHVKKPSESKPTKPSTELVVETVMTQSEKVATEIPTQRECVVKKRGSKRVNKLQFT